jgi:hypothetical protein
VADATEGRAEIDRANSQFHALSYLTAPGAYRTDPALKLPNFNRIAVEGVFGLLDRSAVLAAFETRRSDQLPVRVFYVEAVDGHDNASLGRERNRRSVCR